MRKMRGRKGFFAIKIYLEKAHDRLNWNFITTNLEQTGIKDSFIKLIMECITSTSLNAIWNGCKTEFFKPSRGVRQGDPLSPYIFVLCMDRFSRRICEAVDDKR